MRTIHRIGIGFLVGLFFAGGYAARTMSMHREMAAAGLDHQGPVRAPGIPIASARLEGGANIDLRPLETMLMVLKHLREHYVEQLAPADEGKMTHDSIRAMLASLNDPNTRFLDPAQRKLLSDAREGKFHGIGAVLGIKRLTEGKVTDEHLVVIAPIEGGSADKAGLRPGDDIVEIDGKSVLPFDPYQKASEMLKDEWAKRTKDQSQVRKDIESEKKRIDNGVGILDAERMLTSDSDAEKDRAVELTVLRKGSAKPLKIKVTRESFSAEPVASSVLDGGAGYVRVNCISEATGEQLAAALDDLRGKQVKGLVLDLRNLAGGDVDAVVEVAKPFIPGKSLGTEVRSRGRRTRIDVPATAEVQKWSAPVVVLVNRGTARMSEVLAASLRENSGAKLIGEKTYGDFSATTVIDQRDGSALALTTGLFVTSKGGNYNGKGLPVDVEVASAQTGDPQLKEAAKLAASGGSRS